MKVKYIYKYIFIYKIKVKDVVGDYDFDCF